MNQISIDDRHHELRHCVAAAAMAALVALTALPATAEVVSVATSGALSTALATVADGDVIELAAGTYVSPTSGFEIFNPGRSFTLRAASGATAVLTGEGTHPVLEIQNTAVEPEVSVLFENLVFADGLSTQDGIAAGVTLVRAVATFVGCTFRDCAAESDTTGGGGAGLFSQSVAHFFDCTFDGNTARAEGGGLKVGGGSSAVIHRCRFMVNRTDVTDHRRSAAGGAIHVGNATAVISNTRFESNRSGFAGGALYVIGDWNGESDYASEALVVNSTFDGNTCAPASGIVPPSPTAGGAVNIEDDARVRVFNSRFTGNHAEAGGAIGNYRAVVEVVSTVFDDNYASGDSSDGLVGGTLSAGSNDTTADGQVNRPTARVSVLDSLIVGHDGGGAFKGGCFFVQGDSNRQFGFNNVTPMGGLPDNRAELSITDSAFIGCDVIRQDGVTGTGTGGAVSANLVELDVDGSIFADSHAIGTNSSGGAMRLSSGSAATLADSTFTDNSADNSGGAISVVGSHLEVTGCTFSGHSLDSGDIGSLFWLTPWDDRDLDVTGFFADNLFTGNQQVEVWDQDPAGGSSVAVEFNSNDFDLGGGDAEVFRGTATGSLTVAGLNASQFSSVPNAVLTTAPDAAALLAVPPAVIPAAAAGDPTPSTVSYLAYAWSGGSGQLDGSPLSAAAGAVPADPGNHVLTVGNRQTPATVGSLAAPTATLDADPSQITAGESATLGWTSSGTVLRWLGIDRNVEIANPGASGTVVVAPQGSRQYRLLAVYDEGAATGETAVWVDEAPPWLFADGFESGTLAAWSEVVVN